MLHYLLYNSTLRFPHGLRKYKRLRIYVMYYIPESAHLQAGDNCKNNIHFIAHFKGFFHKPPLALINRNASVSVSTSALFISSLFADTMVTPV